MLEALHSPGSESFREGASLSAVLSNRALLKLPASALRMFWKHKSAGRFQLVKRLVMASQQWRRWLTTYCRRFGCRDGLGLEAVSL